MRAREVAHLSWVYDKLVSRQQQLTDFLKRDYQQGLKDLHAMGADVPLNFDTISDSLETYAALEAKNREIDQLNISLETAEKELITINRLLESAYFGKIMVDFLDGEEEEAFYIGLGGFTDENQNNLIYDWRSPIAELFYNNQIGASSYQVAEELLAVSINQRRQFIIEAERLLQVFDTTVSIQDDVLLAALANNPVDKMQDITASIQKEQNQIIRDTEHGTILVNGVAGSGKTSVVMQRIAYLLYVYQAEITSENVLILSPNTRFVDYISEVLPSLGEKNPLNMTIRQLAEVLLSENFPLETEEDYLKRMMANQVSPEVENLRNLNFAKFIQKASEESLNRYQPKFVDLTYQGEVLISKKTIADIFEQTPVNYTLLERIQATKEVLLSDWQDYLFKQSEDADTQAQVLSLSEEEQYYYFGQLIEDDRSQAIQRYTRRFLQKKFQNITEGLTKNNWIDTFQLFQSLYQQFTGSDYVIVKNQEQSLDLGIAYLLTLHQCVERLAVPNLRFLLIDEVQDYTLVQLYLLTHLFPKASFTMVGDNNQAIFNASLGFEEAKALLEEQRGEVMGYQLFNSYRSSGEITKLFSRLIENTTEFKLVSIRAEGLKPTYESFENSHAFSTLVEKELAKWPEEEVTIITKTEAEAEGLRGELSDLPERLVVCSIALAKGLEFKHVILYDASEQNYHSPREKRILYTAISRATESLCITYQQKLTTFLT